MGFPYILNPPRTIPNLKYFHTNVSDKAFWKKISTGSAMLEKRPPELIVDRLIC